MKIRWRLVAMLLLALGAAGFGLVGAHAAGFGAGSPSAASAPKKPLPTSTPKAPRALPAASIELMSTPDEIVCDGTHAARVRVHVRDENGHDVDDGMPVYFGMTGRVGSLSPDVATTAKGIAETDAHAIFDPLALYRPFYVRIDVGRLQATIRVFCLPPSDCVPGVPCTPCDQQTSPPQVSPPPCPPSPPPCTPVSPPQAFSPPCEPPTQCDPTSPPQSVSPPCFVPTPPSPPPCTPTSPPQSPPGCATPTPGCSPFEPLSPPCVPPPSCGAPSNPPCGNPYAVALDCDIAAAGIQSNCSVPPGATSLDVAVVFENNSDVETSLAAFNFEVHDSDTSRLNPPPGIDNNFDGNPDFNQADLKTSWTCNLPPPTADNGLDGPGRANSFLGCFMSEFTAPPVTIGKINLAIVHYAIPPNATAGSVQLALDVVSVANSEAIALFVCDQGITECPPPTTITIGSGLNGVPSTATPTATPTAG